jgi:hypothetical protein
MQKAGTGLSTNASRGLLWAGKTALSLTWRAAVFSWPLLLILLWLPHHWNRTDEMRDTPIYYHAARRALQGRPLYQAWPDYGPDHFLDRYFYPPPFAAALKPLGHLSPRAFSNLWYLLLMAAFWNYAWCLATLACGRASVSGVLTAGLCLWLFPCTSLAISYGNAEPFVWALFGWALVARARGRGVALALATLVKVHPALVLLVACRREGRSVGIPAAAALAVGLAVGGLICGFAAYRDWWLAVPSVVGQGSFYPANVSISFAGLRLAKELGWHYAGGPLPAMARLYLTAVGLIAPLCAIYLTRKCAPVLQYALVANAVILFAPLCWHMYLPALLAPAAILFNKWRLADRPAKKLLTEATHRLK